jgi:hypothetical protein
VPLLATVLAGFAMVTLASVAVQSNIKQMWSPLNFGLVLGVLCLSASIPLLIVATFFAIWGQAFTYQSLTEEVRDLMGITLEGDDLRAYLAEKELLWLRFHRDAVIAIVFGAIAFLIGIGSLVWSLLGTVVGLCFGFVTVVTVIWLWYETGFRSSRKAGHK